MSAFLSKVLEKGSLRLSPNQKYGSDEELLISLVSQLPVH